MGITIALSVLTAAMAIYGGYMLAKTPLKQSVFLACGVVMFILIILQSMFNDRDIRDRDGKIDKMNGSLENVQGQLTAFRELMANIIDRSSGVNPQHLSIENHNNIDMLSNIDLRTRVIQLSKNMMDFETNFKKEERQRDFNLNPSGTEEDKRKQWQQQTNISMQRRLEYANEFRKRYLGESLVLRDELLKRLNIIPPNEEKNIIALDGFLAGPSPISDLAIYLEKYARQLSN